MRALACAEMLLVEFISFESQSAERPALIKSRFRSPPSEQTCTSWTFVKKIFLPVTFAIFMSEIYFTSEGGIVKEVSASVIGTSLQDDL